MKLVDHTLTSFINLLASDAPAPGGGSTAALAGALGAALIHMVGALTSGRPKYAEHQVLLDELAAQSEKLKNDFLDVIDRDTEAFNSVTAVFSLPKATEADKAARKQAMQEALKTCTRTPFEMMILAQSAIELAARAVGKTNPNTASDFGVAALSLKAAVQGAWLNVLINVGGIEDQEFVARYKGDGQKILNTVIKQADEIHQGVVDSLS